MYWGKTLQKMELLKNKEVMIINESYENAIFKNKIHKNILLKLSSKSKIFGLLEIRIGKNKYYLIRDDVLTKHIFLIRDDEGGIVKIFEYIFGKITKRLEEIYQTEMDFIGTEDDKLIFSDFRDELDDIEDGYKEIYSGIEIDGETIPVKVLKGKVSDKIYVQIHVNDFAPIIIKKLKGKYKLNKKIGHDNQSIME